MKQQDYRTSPTPAWLRLVLVIVSTTIACLLLALFVAVPAPLQAAPRTDALVRTEPTAVTTTTDAISIPVDILIEDVAGLYGADVRLAFDPNLLAVQDANPNQAGIQIDLGPLLTSSGYYVVFNTANNVSGTIQLVMTQLNPAQPVTGTGVLARITFKPIGPVGTSSLHFTYVELASRTGATIPSTVQDGTVTVELPPPDLSKSAKLASAMVVSPTGQLTYTIVLTNSGPSTANNVLLTDAIPIGSAYLPGSLTGASATFNASQNQIEWRGVVSATSSVTLTYAVAVSATAGSTIINEAYVSINNALDRILTVETPVTPATNPPRQYLYLPIIAQNF